MSSSFSSVPPPAWRYTLEVSVLTGPDSGNIAAQVKAGLAGRVLADEAALFAAFETGEVLSLSRSARGARVRDMVFSGLTASPGVRPGP